MNREERRRAERRAAAGRSLYQAGRWVAPAGQITGARTVSPDRDNAEIQDFIAGTIPAAGAALLSPETAGAAPEVREMPPLFTVLVNDDASTYGPCPQLQDLFERLDRGGPATLHAELDVGTSWSVMARPPVNALVKLKLDFYEPVRGTAHILLMANNYAGLWQYVAGGGMVGITTPQRLRRVQNNPDATYATVLRACIPVTVASSPGIQQVIRMFGWPANHLVP